MLEANLDLKYAFESEEYKSYKLWDKFAELKKHFDKKTKKLKLNKL